MNPGGRSVRSVAATRPRPWEPSRSWPGPARSAPAGTARPGTARRRPDRGWPRRGRPRWPACRRGCAAAPRGSGRRTTVGSASRRVYRTLVRCTLPAVFRRPELLVAASVPVLLLAGVLPWHRDVLCMQSGCGPVTASAWTGSPVWALVLLLALALAGAWVLALPTRGRVPLAVAALTGVAGVVSAAVVVVSLDALVFNRAGFFGFDLPVTET